MIRRRRPAELDARGLRKSFGGVHALDGFDLHVARSECVAIIGANGSGKTTALRALSGVMPVDEGEVLLNERPPPGPAPRAWVDAGIVCTLQGTAIYRSLTALENAITSADSNDSLISLFDKKRYAAISGSSAPFLTLTNFSTPQDGDRSGRYRAKPLISPRGCRAWPGPARLSSPGLPANSLAKPSSSTIWGRHS